MKPRPTDLLRFALWLGLANTANANRKYYGLATTWVFHLALDSFILCLPEILSVANKLLRLDARSARQRGLVAAWQGALDDAVINNPNYALYVAPVVLAYIVSHPRFNIYKGDYANIRLLGFGLDAIPHAVTAFAFTNLVVDTLAAFRSNTPADASWRRVAEFGDDHAIMLAGALLLGVSAAYEFGEYEIHESEMRVTGGDVTRINLVWDAKDTLFDLVSNTLGWVAGALVRRRRRPTPRRVLVK